MRRFELAGVALADYDPAARSLRLVGAISGVEADEAGPPAGAHVLGDVAELPAARGRPGDDRLTGFRRAVVLAGVVLAGGGDLLQARRQAGERPVRAGKPALPVLIGRPVRALRPHRRLVDVNGARVGQLQRLEFGGERVVQRVPHVRAVGVVAHPQGVLHRGGELPVAAAAMPRPGRRDQPFPLVLGRLGVERDIPLGEGFGEAPHLVVRARRRPRHEDVAAAGGDDVGDAVAAEPGEQGDEVGRFLLDQGGRVGCARRGRLAMSKSAGSQRVRPWW
ncbi:hypothetical protein [Nonomuraea aridisoli]|uniref:hypothetical protein n=1 Tax=Nonomuraea aridisoli TaxID=2070368 RepID=UPI0015E8B2A2|nr:hypothetical protein [Nonomuraea aridisoli]